MGRMRLLVVEWFEATGDSPVRSYLAGNAGSRLISEAKQPWACLVLGWGTTGEAHVLYSTPIQAPTLTHSSCVCGVCLDILFCCRFG